MVLICLVGLLHSKLMQGITLLPIKPASTETLGRDVQMLFCGKPKLTLLPLVYCSGGSHMPGRLPAQQVDAGLVLVHVIACSFVLL